MYLKIYYKLLLQPEGYLGSFSPNLLDTRTVTLTCNPVNDIPVKGEIITKELRGVIS